MKSFPLLQLEQHIADEFLINGEQLYEHGSVQHLQEADKNLWSAQVEVEQEVEVKISPSKVVEASCTCSVFAEDKCCEHIVATLFALRNLLQSRKPKPVQKEEFLPQNDKFTTAAVLKQIDETTLKEFVRQYAHKDRNFALALKTKFVGLVEVTDNKEKYLQILDDAIKAARKKNKHFSQRGEQKIIKIAEDLLSQAESAFAESHFLTVVLIAQALIEKLTPIQRKMDYSSKETAQLLEQSFALLQQVLDKQPAPALLEALWNYVVLECQKITYRINELVPLFYRLLTSLAAKTNKRQEALTLLEQLSIQAPFSEKNYTRLLMARVVILEQLNRQEEAQKILRNNVSHPDLLLFAILQATKREDWEEVKFLSDIGLRNALPTNIRQQVEEARLNIAIRDGEMPMQAQLGKQRLLETFEWRYYKILKQATPSKWQETLEQLLQAIEKTTYSPNRYIFLAALNAEEGKYNDLFDFIKKIQSLDLLQEYFKVLSTIYQSEVHVLYKSLLYQFLEQHIGKQASKKVFERLKYLYEIGENDLADEMSATIKQKYQERHTLMDVLMVLEEQA